MKYLLEGFTIKCSSEARIIGAKLMVFKYRIKIQIIISDLIFN